MGRSRSSARARSGLDWLVKRGKMKAAAASGVQGVQLRHGGTGSSCTRWPVWDEGLVSREPKHLL